MASKKYYAVKNGKTPGIYVSWEECKKMVDGYPGAVYKGFPTWEEAEAFLGADGNRPAGAKVENGKADRPAGTKAENGKADRLSAANGTGGGRQAALPENYAFVDGSYNVAAKIYGFGGFLIHDGEKEILQGFGTDAEMASMRNVAGEILGSMAAVEKAIELGLPELTVYYDYMGIEMWANGGWKRNKKGTIAYYDYMQSVKDRILVHFVKVKGHSGVEGNEEADRLAREAVGN